MKLLTKLTLFITLSKLLIVVLFVLLLPSLVSVVSSQYTNYYLRQQKKKVLNVIDKNGVDYYLQGDSAYASYTMLKEEYISLVPAYNNLRDTIETSHRIVEEDTLNYRILIHELNFDNKKYILEIGKTTATIGEYNSLLQRFTLYILIGLILLSIVVDLVYTNLLLRPLAKIVRTKLLNRKFPFREPLSPVKTSTTDFKFLDSSLISLMEKIHEAFDKEREFTSNASHELMTPISILQTNIENMMMEEDVSEELQEKLSAVMKTVNRLKKIVHSLLYISRIENDQFAKADTVNVQNLTIEVMEELSHRLETKSIRFTNEITKGVILQKVNHDLFFQLLYNLINNSIRYNKENGAIDLSDHYVLGEPYILYLKDTGIGIREGEIGTIFNRFKKSGHAISEGYGLGLSIVQSISTFHGFDIKVSSVYGEGTVFSIVIPPEMIVN
ncbi:HAMP domain-containing histidine kinase [Ginsengibacter hankyongi]|uniref:histidine kinase n=1 Tax=Ginsengibacter hankyongi TaxID=2607284 RepID=A0A5J5IJ68_9BACT|nr:HAMP domain-containing sensor histidine kinase [Ginsengibacter hankyongi]KAA9040538.1 HAMP domain-containing histidine kinase [Ginsengibacter hankyongi]